VTDRRRAIVVHLGRSDRASTIVARLRQDQVSVAVLGPDLGDWDGAHESIGAQVAELGGLDVLVVDTSASEDDLEVRFSQQDEQAISTLVGRHFGAAVAVVHAGLAALRAAGRGRIITIAGRDSAVVVDACMGAVMGLTVNLAEELPDGGISIVTVAPEPGAAVDDVAAVVAFLAKAAGEAVHGGSVSVRSRIAASVVLGA
jgi:NAD(P)-dependent dehydrogenase (short-subunit alcohol dehydrogenase family)